MSRLSDWTRQVDEIMMRDYAISLDDIGLSHDEIRRSFFSEPDPKEFAEWFARKYDLTSERELGVHARHSGRPDLVSLTRGSGFRGNER